MIHRIVLLLVLSTAATASAQKSDRPAATAALKRAKAHFDLQEYALAEQELKEAYRIDPKPEILYAIAQAQRLGGACDRAITTYKNFLRARPGPEQAKQAEDNIARCEADLKATPPEQPPPEPTSPPEPAEPASPVVEPVPAAPPPPEAPATGVPWTRNWIGHVLLVGGLGLAAGGTYLALDADRTIRDINGTPFYDAFVARSGDFDAARTRRTIGFAAVGTGGALVLTGVVMYILRSPGERPRASMALGARGEVIVAWELW
jgi:tetratricopeptide (TPR) repeat protein